MVGGYLQFKKSSPLAFVFIGRMNLESGVWVMGLRWVA